MSGYNYKIGMIKFDIIELLEKKSAEIYEIDQSYRDFKADDLIIEMCDYYIWRFEEDFFDYINQNMRIRLSCFGRNIGYALKSFIKLYSTCDIHTLNKFIKEFVDIQFDDLDNWGYGLQLSYGSGQEAMIMQKKTV